MQRLGLSYTPKTESRLKELLWPDVNNIVAIKTVCHTGMWVCFIVGGFSAVFDALAENWITVLMTIGIFGAIGIGIRRCSRVAAVLAVLFYVGSQILVRSFSVVSVIFSFLFISSARAAFAYHGMRKQQAQPVASADVKTE
jgi:hypothetical protein